MPIAQLLATERIMTQAKVSSKKKLLEFIAERAAESLNLPQSDIYHKLLDRERLGSTGLGHGFAVPHARLKDLDSAHGCLVSLEEAINYDAIDHEKVDLIFVLLIPEESTDEHLKILASLARLFSQKTLTDKIRNSHSPVEILDTISQAELDS